MPGGGKGGVIAFLPSTEPHEDGSSCDDAASMIGRTGSGSFPFRWFWSVKVKLPGRPYTLGFLGATNGVESTSQGLF